MARTVLYRRVAYLRIPFMVADGDEAKALPATVIAPLEVPVETQVMWMKRSSVQNVGILFGPARRNGGPGRCGGLKARRLLAGHGASDRSDFAPEGIDRLTNNVDALHIPDTTVFAREHSRQGYPARLAAGNPTR